MRGRRAEGACTCIAFALLAVLFGAAPARAGAWTEPKGQGQTIATIAVGRASDAFDAGGEMHGSTRFRKEDYEIYDEYGLTDRLTALVNLRYTTLHPDPPSQSASGLGEAEIGIRQRLVNTRAAVLSVQASGFVPGGTVLTSGGPDGELRLLAGSSFRFWRKDVFVDSEIAYRLRANGFSDEVHADLTLGIDLSRRWSVFVQSFSILTVTSGRTNSFEGEETKLELSLLYRLSPKWRVQLGGLGVVTGTNVPAERALLAALWYRF